MVEVVPLDVLEVLPLELAEVHRVVDPLLRDVGLQQAPQEDGRGVEGEQEADCGQDQREGSRVADGAAHVVAVPRALVVLDVEVVEVPVQRVPPDRGPVGEAAVQDVTVDQVLEPGPGQDPQGEPRERRRPVRRAEGQAQDGHGVRGIERGDGIEPPPGLARLVLASYAGARGKHDRADRARARRQVSMTHRSTSRASKVPSKPHILS